MEVGQELYVVPVNAGKSLLGKSGVGLRRGLLEGVDFRLLTEDEWEKYPEKLTVERIPRHVVLRGSGARVQKSVEIYPVLAKVYYWANGMYEPKPIYTNDKRPFFVNLLTTMEVFCTKDILWSYLSHQFKSLFPEIAQGNTNDYKSIWDKCIRLRAKSRLDGDDWRTLVASEDTLDVGDDDVIGDLNLPAPLENDTESDEDYCVMLLECRFLNAENPQDARSDVYYLSDVENFGWRAVLGPGDYVDAQDKQDDWFESKIVEVDENKVKVHFCSWHSKFDEVIDIDSEKLARLHSHTPQWREGIKEGDELDYCPYKNQGMTKDWHVAKVESIQTTQLEENQTWPTPNPKSLISGQRIYLHLLWDDKKSRVNASDECIAQRGVHIRQKVAKKVSTPASTNGTTSSRFGHSSGSYLSSSSSYSRPLNGTYYRYGQGKPEVDGVVGLLNLGNTCFLNSILQCLSNSKPLLEYFLRTDEEGTPTYAKEINHNNPLGMNGKIATAFANLLRQMWSNEYTVVTPTELKQVIGEYAPAFAGYAQQDSQEVLSFILDGLHEDLNRVLEKPYTKAIEPAGRPDTIVAQEEWQQYLRRNDSIITDNFMAQLRSHVTCPSCQHESITFDPYMSLSVPVPNQVSFLISLYPLDGSAPTQFGLIVSKEGTVGDAKAALSLHSGVPVDHLIFAYVKNHRITSACLDTIDVAELVSENAQGRSGVVAYELEMPLSRYEVRSSNLFADTSPANLDLNLDSPGELAMCLVALQHQMPSAQPLSPLVESGPTEENSSLRYSSLPNKTRRVELRLFQMPSLISIRRDATYQEIHAKIAKMVSRLIKDKDSSKPYMLHITNTRVDDYLLRDVPESEAESLSPELTRRSITFTLEWSNPGFKNNYNEASIRQLHLHSSVDDIKLSYRRELALDLRSCIVKFTEREQLGENDTWYCPKCKQHVRAFKKFDLFSLPKILLIQLKRFRYNQGMYLLHRDKINTLVKFPIQGLDLSEFVIRPHTSAVYDLYAVSEHSGGLGGGHYTAKAKNPRNGEWYNFNDSSTSSTNASDAVTSQAYVLFYLRRD
ncbi:ubiquitin-specific protease [Thraustotheca clavata]|uniref:Ubiquitin-specific protease n=1 Tax=Thraustotheca clavata TaxID=74557 RepID=A0A1W0A1T5_9STRA|nr:ubiquitin-specific protease [Thraustotheca clavata]